MATTQVNRAHETTATTGTGTLTLTGAVNAYQTFDDAGVADTNTVRYLILDDDNAWEIGTGTYGVAGSVRTLARSVEESSNADALLDLTGNASVAVVLAAADLLGSASSPTFASVILSGTDPKVELLETDAAADNQKWRILSSSTKLRVAAVNDAGVAGGDYWEFTRSGNNVTSLVGVKNNAATITLDNATGTITLTSATLDGTPLVSGGRALLATLTASSSTVLDFTAFDSTKYHAYEFVVDALHTSADAYIYIRTSSDAGVSYDSTASDYTWWYTANGTNSSSTTADQITITNAQNQSGANWGYSGQILLQGADDVTRYTQITGAVSHVRPTNALKNVQVAGGRKENAVVNGLRFTVDTGNFVSGNIYVYGLVK